jgi:hypothetical protein
VSGDPAEREEKYAITSEYLNELGKITQTMAGRSELMTITDMIYWLNRVQYIPQGNAESSFNLASLAFETSAVGVLSE